MRHKHTYRTTCHSDQREESCKVHQLFGDKLNAIIEELNETLAA